MLKGATKFGGSVFFRLSTRGYPNNAGFGLANRTKGYDAITADQFHRAMTKDGFKPCRLLLRDGQEIHVLSAGDYGLDRGHAATRGRSAVDPARPTWSGSSRCPTA